MRNISYILDKPVGFSNGWAEFDTKNPPPLLPSSFIDSREATGPIVVCCSVVLLLIVDSNGLIVIDESRVWGTPIIIKINAETNETGSNNVKITLIKSI